MQDKTVKTILRRTPESAAMVASVQRAIAITTVLNRLSFDDAEQIRSVFSDLIGYKVDDSFSLIPPFYATGGENTRIGRGVFVNQNCTMYDLGGIDIGMAAVAHLAGERFDEPRLAGAGGPVEKKRIR